MFCLCLIAIFTFEYNLVLTVNMLYNVECVLAKRLVNNLIKINKMCLVVLRGRISETLRNKCFGQKLKSSHADFN